MKLTSQDVSQSSGNQSSPVSPLDVPPSVDRIIDWQREHDEMYARRCVTVGRLLGTANYIRSNPVENLSPKMKDQLLNDIVRYADEFLEGR